MENKIMFEEERILTPPSGFPMLIAGILGIIASTALIVFSIIRLSGGAPLALWLTILLAAIAGVIVFPILLCGLKIINPNEAGVYVLFGNYYGTIVKAGFYFINPFCALMNPTVTNPAVPAGEVAISIGGTNKKVSLKAITHSNERQKINDSDGNPIETGIIVIWRVVNATKAVFEVDDYTCYVSTQCDAALRNVARKYPYDISSEGDEKSLRGSSNEVAEELKKDLQTRVDIAGLEIIETRIAHLAYAQEIAAAMLQRQQAAAVVEAKQTIVEAAVGMVEMALNRLSEREIVNLDEERKAAMVSNLMVVLCGSREAQPIVNSGSLY